MISWPCLFGYYQRECQISKDIVDNSRDLFESRISAGGIEKLYYSGKSEANISSWSSDVEGHAKKCVKDIANMLINKFNNYTQSQLRVLTTINSKKKKFDLLEKCQKYALKLFSNACTLLELVDLIFCGQ